MTVREMQDFERFILRTYRIKIKFKETSNAKLVILTQDGSPYLKYEVRKNKTLHLVHDGAHHGSISRKFAQLVRFHITNTHPSISVRGMDAFSDHIGQCNRHNCFQYMRDAFPDEWKMFKSGCSPNIFLSDATLPDLTGSDTHKLTQFADIFRKFNVALKNIDVTQINIKEDDKKVLPF